MIIVRISLNVLLEKRLEFMQTLFSLIEPTRKEVGCLGYTIFSDIEDKNRFNLLEEWETREDLDHHIKSHRFGVLLGTKTLLGKPLEIQIFTVEASEGIEAVNSVRKNKDDPVVSKKRSKPKKETGGRRKINRRRDGA